MSSFLIDLIEEKSFYFTVYLLYWTRQLERLDLKNINVKVKAPGRFDHSHTMPSTLCILHNIICSKYNKITITIK